MTTTGARIGFASAAAAVAAGSVLLAAPAASAADAPVCGPSVPISGEGSATNPVALTVPQYDGGGTLTGVAITLVPTTHYNNVFLNLSTFSTGAGSAANAYSGAAVVMQATGPGLAAFHDFKLRLANPPSDPGNPGPGSAFVGGPGSFTAGTPQPTLPTDLAAAEAVGAAGTSTAAAAPADWTALGYPFTPNASVPASAGGDLTYAKSSAGNVSAAGLAAYAGSGSVALSAIDDSEVSTSADSTSGNWAAGSNETSTVQACATYTTDGPAAALPETPRALLLPLSAFAIGGGALILRRRRRTA